MRTSAHNKSDRAIELALNSIGGGETTALVVLFFGVARKLSEALDSETAAELAYRAADELVTRGRK